MIFRCGRRLTLEKKKRRRIRSRRTRTCGPPPDIKPFPSCEMKNGCLSYAFIMHLLHFQIVAGTFASTQTEIRASVARLLYSSASVAAWTPGTGADIQFGFILPAHLTTGILTDSLCKSSTQCQCPLLHSHLTEY